MNLVDTLVEQVRQYADSPAIIESDGGHERVWTFSELERATAQATALLKQYTFKKGDAILVFQPVSAELYIILLAIFRLGLVAMFLDPSAGKKHIEQCCLIGKPKGFIATRKAHLLRLVSSSIRHIPNKFVVESRLPLTHRWDAWKQQQPSEEIVGCFEETPALLTFTSGSTGRPKAVMRSHGFLLKQHAILKDSIDLQAGQRDLSTLPIFVLANLASGVTSIIPEGDLLRPGFIDPEPVLRQIQRLKPDRAGAAPAFFEQLLSKSDEYPRALDSLIDIYTGGGPTFIPFLDRLQQAVPKARVTAVYGSTEAEPISHATVEEIRLWGDTFGRGIPAGKPVDAIHCRVIQDHWGKPLLPMTECAFDERTQPTSGIGEIVVSGECVIEGYHDDYGNEETKFLVDETVWHRTGDSGFFDKNGVLWLTGRCQGRVVIESQTVYPFQVETLTHRFPEIRRSALMNTENAAVLALEYVSGVSSEKTFSVVEEMRALLAKKGLSAIELRTVEHIPVDKRHNSKVDYTELRKRLH